MKKISLTAFILLFPLMVFSQTKPADSARDKELGNEQQKIQKQEKALSADNNSKPSKNDRFVDLDGDGINDIRTGGNMSKFQKKMIEPFTDKDGDGINDNRAKGIGWSTIKEKQKGFGRHQEIAFPREYLPLFNCQIHT